MNTLTRPVRSGETDRAWKTVRSAHLAGGYAEFARLCEREPGFIRITEYGDIAILGRWRAHLDVLAVRVLRSRPAAVGPMIEDIRRFAASSGYASVMSPLTAVSNVEPFTRAGMRERIRLRAFVRDAGASCPASAKPPSARIRLATPDDLGALTALDARCFESFWRYGAAELSHALAHERLTVCEDACGELMGYASCGLSGASITVGRLAVDGARRRSGLGAALLDDALRWARTTEALGVSLCTQLDNTAARGLYNAGGFEELDEEYALMEADALEA